MSFHLDVSIKGNMSNHLDVRKKGGMSIRLDVSTNGGVFIHLDSDTNHITRDVFYVCRMVDLIKTAKVNAYIMYIFGKIELLSMRAT